MTVAVVDIGSTVIKYGMVDGLSNKLFVCKEAPTNASEGAVSVLNRVADLLKPYEFKKIGLCSGGQIKDGKVIYATENLPGYTGMEVAEFFNKKFRVPVAVENDVNAAAIGELAFGAARGIKNFICITIGTGIGGAIVIDDKVYSGNHGGAGEFGHFTTHKGGLPCSCGQKGCFEAYASTTALTKKAATVYGSSLNGREIFEQIEKGNTELKKVLGAWTREIAVGLSGLIHILNPEAVILGGGIMEREDVLNKIKKATNKYLMSSYKKDIKILSAKLGNNAGLMGMYILTENLRINTNYMFPLILP